MARKKKFYFGWTKIKWAISEISKLYSDEKSYFSKKRVESGIGFIIAQWGMIYFLTKKIDVKNTIRARVKDSSNIVSISSYKKVNNPITTVVVLAYIEIQKWFPEHNLMN